MIHKVGFSIFFEGLYSVNMIDSLFTEGHQNVKIFIEMTSIPRRTIYDNLKKFKQQRDLERKLEAVDSNSTQMFEYVYYVWSIIKI